MDFGGDKYIQITAGTVCILSPESPCLFLLDSSWIVSLFLGSWLTVNSLPVPLCSLWQWVTAGKVGLWDTPQADSLRARNPQLPWQQLKFPVMGWKARCLFICEKSILRSQSACSINMPGMRPSRLDFLLLVWKYRFKPQRRSWKGDLHTHTHTPLLLSGTHTPMQAEFTVLRFQPILF